MQVRKQQLELDMEQQTGSKLEKGYMKTDYCQPTYLTYMQEYIMRNVELDEAQAGIKIARRNINNLRYVDDADLKNSGKEELKSLWMRVKEKSEKADLKLNIQKFKIMASGTITSWQIDRETMETVTGFIFVGSKITVDGDCTHEIKKCLLLGRKAKANLDRVLKIRDITFANKGPLQSKLWFFQESCMDVRVGP